MKGNGNTCTHPIVEIGNGNEGARASRGLDRKTWGQKREEEGKREGLQGRVPEEFS